MGIELFELLPVLLSCVMGVGLTILWVWMIVDCATKEPSEDSGKILLILVIVLTHWIGALIYLLARRPKRIQMYGK